MFEPERLREIIGELGQEVQPMRRVGGRSVEQFLVAVDGSVVKTLATIAQASYLKNRHGENNRLGGCIPTSTWTGGVPTQIDVTSGLNSGKSDEKNVLRRRLAADHCYVMDRWFAQFELFNDIDAIGSSYACRVRDNSRYEVVEARPLSDESLSLNVLSDEIVKLGAGSPRSKSPNHPVRLIRVRLSASRTLWTGGKPTLRTFEMVCLYLQGWADQDELIAHLKKLKPPVA